jgi:hypothetical protein
VTSALTDNWKITSLCRDLGVAHARVSEILMENHRSRGKSRSFVVTWRDLPSSSAVSMPACLGSTR